MSIIRRCIFLYVLAIFTSCDCLQHVQGVVIDFDTKSPISNVMVIKDINRVIYTDSLGNFNFTSVTGSLFRCPKVLLSFQKEGYDKKIKKYKTCCTDNVVITLKKETNKIRK